MMQGMRERERADVGTILPVFHGVKALEIINSHHQSLDLRRSAVSWSGEN